jgi:ribosomal protein S25
LAVAKKKRGAKTENASSVTRAFQELRELIVRGNLPPGAWIVEAEIASRLGLSRTPIRSALQWLHREGYVVEHKGNRKARIVVAPLTREDARELYMIIGHLETMAGTTITSLSGAQRARVADELASFNEELNVIASQRPVDPRRVFDIDKEFHARIMKAGAGRRPRGAAQCGSSAGGTLLASLCQLDHQRAARVRLRTQRHRARDPEGRCGGRSEGARSQLVGRIRSHQSTDRNIRRTGELVGSLRSRQHCIQR